MGGDESRKITGRLKKFRTEENVFEIRKKLESDESYKKLKYVTAAYVLSSNSQTSAFLTIVRRTANTDWLYPDSLTVGRKEFQRSSEVTRSLPSSPKRLAVVPPKPQSPGESFPHSISQHTKQYYCIRRHRMEQTKSGEYLSVSYKLDQKIINVQKAQMLLKISNNYSVLWIITVRYSMTCSGWIF